MAHLAERQDRLVAKGPPEIRVGNDGEDVLTGHDAMHPRNRLGRGSIDMADMSVWDRAAAGLGMQHARQAQIVNIFGPPGDLGASLDPLQGTADLSGGGRDYVVHAASACCSARRRCTSTSTRL